MKELKRNLESCNKIFEANKNDPVLSQLMLKLMLHELAGWIELSFDDIYIATAENLKNKEMIDKEIVKPCFSFKYNDFCKTLRQCIGINNVIKLENSWKKKDKQDFIATLNNIAKYRDTISHTYYRDSATDTYMGYNTILNNLKIIDKGMKFINNFLSNNSLISVIASDS